MHTGIDWAESARVLTTEAEKSLRPAERWYNVNQDPNVRLAEILKAVTLFSSIGRSFSVLLQSSTLQRARNVTVLRKPILYSNWRGRRDVSKVKKRVLEICFHPQY